MMKNRILLGAALALGLALAACSAGKAGPLSPTPIEARGAIGASHRALAVDQPIHDTFLVADEVYWTNVDLAAQPPGRQSGRKLLGGQTDPTENGLRELGWDDENAVATWGDRLCPDGFLIVRVGDGSNVGQNVGAGLYNVDGTGKTWGTDPIAVRAGLVKRFRSAVQTGTGSEMTVAHGLGVTPSLVIVEVTRLPALADILTLPAQLWTPGTHTATNVVLTAADGLQFYVTALP